MDAEGGEVGGGGFIAEEATGLHEGVAVLLVSCPARGWGRGCGVDAWVDVDGFGGEEVGVDV